jgi:tRNA (mo5U34)-methyltransferase
MPSKLLRLGPFGAGVTLGDGTLSVEGRLQGAPWSAIYRTLKRITRSEAPQVALSKPVPASEAGGDDPEAAAIRKRIEGIVWYHTIDLGHGVATPGAFNHLPVLDQYCVPDDLTGKRVLDIGTFDGFWAFEFEKRGATVVALDLDNAGQLDLPAQVRAKTSQEELNRKFGNGFAIVHDILGSRVERVVNTVYEIDPAVHGMFDIVHIGSALIHMRNPIRALQRMRSVARGYALISEPYKKDLERYGPKPLVECRGGREDCNWYRFSRPAFLAMLEGAGFSKVEILNEFDHGPYDAPASMAYRIYKAS